MKGETKVRQQCGAIWTYCLPLDVCQRFTVIAQSSTRQRRYRLQANAKNFKERPVMCDTLPHHGTGMPTLHERQRSGGRRAQWRRRPPGSRAGRH